MIKIAVLAVDENVVDPNKTHGQTVNFESAGDTSVASIVRRNVRSLIAELKKYNYNVDFAELGYLNEDVVDNIITGVRSTSSGHLDELVESAQDEQQLIGSGPSAPNVSVTINGQPVQSGTFSTGDPVVVPAPTPNFEMVNKVEDGVGVVPPASGTSDPENTGSERI